MHRFTKFVRAEDGPTAVEYAVILALIIVACASAIGSVGTNAYKSFWTIVDSLE